MVRITKGTYGNKVGCVVKPVYAGETVELTPEQEERLIRIGVAVKVNETPGETESNAETGSELPEYNEKMKLADLIAIAEKYGVDASKAKSKAEVIATIEAAQELPDLGGDETVVE